jgi:hypothetical protein
MSLPLNHGNPYYFTNLGKNMAIIVFGRVFTRRAGEAEFKVFHTKVQRTTKITKKNHCHSERSEESCLALFKILRFAQDDK